LRIGITSLGGLERVGGGQEQRGCWEERWVGVGDMGGDDHGGALFRVWALDWGGSLGIR